MKKTIPDLFEESLKKFHDNILIWEKRDGKYEGIPYHEVHKRVYQFSSGLMKLGIKKGDRVALLAEGRSEWLSI